MEQNWPWMLAASLMLLCAPALIRSIKRHPRLCVLQLLAYAPIGSFLPVMIVYLKEILHFTPFQIALVIATQAMGSLLTLFLFAQIADRWLPADRCLVFCALCSCGLLWLLPHLTGPAVVFVMCLALWIVSVPTWTLTNAICFTHLENPETQFGGVRVWGTIGWVSAGWLLAYWLSGPQWAKAILDQIRPEAPYPIQTDQFRQGSILAFILACYALTLPHTPPRKSAKVRFAPLKALALVSYRPFAVFLICHFGLCLTFPVSIQNTPLLLMSLGIPKERLTLDMTLAQSTEVVTLLALPWILTRFQFRRALLVGIGAWTLGMAVMMIGEPRTLVIGSLVFHGVYICCFLVTGQVFVNRLATGDIRASAQGLLTFSAGLAMLGGNFLVGWIRELAGERFPPVFGFGAALAAVLLMVFFLGFHHETERLAEHQQIVK